MLIFIDSVLVYVSYKIAFYFRFGLHVPNYEFEIFNKSKGIIIFIYLFIFYIFRLYDRLWQYAGIDEFLLSVGSGTIATLITVLYTIIMGSKIAFGVSLLSGIFIVFLTSAFRMSFRIYKQISNLLENKEINDKKRVMIIGAGSAGVLLIKDMKSRKSMGYEPVALIDDSRAKIGTTIAGVKVYGGRDKIEIIAKNKKIDLILIAIPSLDNKNKKEIIDLCKKTGCKVKIVPSMCEILDEIPFKSLKDVEVEDLLGREPVNLDMEGIADYIKDKSILVTGGGGSIGSELCRQIAKFSPKQLNILDIYENNAYDIQNELKRLYPKLNLKVIIASIRDKDRLDKIFEVTKPDVVFHAAAHKHVPLMEDNPGEAVKNNIFGTLNVAQCADKYKVKRFVMISTDKAVNPTNVMGATKRVCEMIIQAMDKISNTQFVAVRFGNVLGSNGSVIPLFKKQISEGGPVTVTHKNITRFFMTIPEAAQLVLQAGAFAKGGEIFVLDMGKPVKIYDLACDLIRLSGLEPHKDIKIEITGLRPGEKLYEEVLMKEEGLTKTLHNKIFVGKPITEDIQKIFSDIETLREIAEKGCDEEIKSCLKKIVPTYISKEYSEAAQTIL